MASRVDENGIAWKRSQLQIQIAVTHHRDELEAKIRDAFPTTLGGSGIDPDFDWRSPIECDSFREYRDGRMLDQIGRPRLRDALREYWPQRGPNWDGLAVARSRKGEWLRPLLVEAKSYPGELRSFCEAEGDRREKIEERLRATRRNFGVDEKHAPVWTEGFYQAANRLAFLRFFRRRGGGFLLGVYVVGDPDLEKPTSETTWRETISEMHRQLGIDEDSLPDVGHVLIEGRHRSEMIGTDRWDPFDCKEPHGDCSS